MQSLILKRIIQQFDRLMNDAESDVEFISETSFKINHLQKMLAEGTLKMTIPDKPSSRNQKYYS